MSNSDRDDRDVNGLLTPWALAVDALEDNGCDCGTDEPQTCLPCLVSAAMVAERERRLRVELRLDESRENERTLQDRIIGLNQAIVDNAKGHHDAAEDMQREINDLGGMLTVEREEYKDLVKAHERDRRQLLAIAAAFNGYVNQPDCSPARVNEMLEAIGDALGGPWPR